MNNSRKWVTAFLLLSAFVPSAWGDLTVERSAKLYLTDAAGKTRRINREERVLIRNGNVKIVDETFGEVWIVRADRKVVWKIDTVDGTYSEATFDEITERRKATFDEMKEARKRVEGTADAKEIDETLAGLGEYGHDPQIAVKEIGTPETIAGHVCKRTLILVDGKQLINGWHAEDLKEGKEYLKAIALIRGYAPSVAAKLDETMGLLLKGDIRYSFFLDRVTATIETRRVATDALKDEDFDLPAGLPAGLKKVHFVELHGEETAEVKSVEIKKDFPEDDLDKKADPLHGGGR